MGGLISATAAHYDLYRFNQAVELEWENYKATNSIGQPLHPDFTGLVNGRGYLYAHSTDTTLTFSGAPYIGNGEVTLSKTNGVEFAGWNLVGNPFATTAFVDRDFYVMNSTGTEIVAAEGSSVEAMEGIFVVADQDGETMTFSTTAPGAKGASLSLNISQGRGTVVDRAIVRFDKGGTLRKFQLDPSHTRVYIPQEGEDYAVVGVGGDAKHGVATATGVRELPVHFKAAEDGTYTLTVNLDNVEMAYLHLIDNMTGADIDLLPTSETLIAGEDPQSLTLSYTFQAKTTDYASRFRLVFSICGDANGDNGAPFAFISNDNIVVNGEGTLQVIDMMGRVIHSGDAKHCVSTTRMAPGVYVLRLIDGDHVRTQKMVID